MKTLQEQIKDLENTRAAKLARLNEITNKSIAESRGLDEAEGEESDNLTADIESIDKDLVRLRKLEALNVKQAARVDNAAGETAEGASRQRAAGAAAGRSGPHIVTLERKREKGCDFARFAGCMAFGKGSVTEALAFARRRFADDAMLHKALELRQHMSGEEIIQRAAVDIGTTTDADFASPLVYYTNMANEFIEFLRPQTIIGRLQGLRMVPFDIRMSRQTGGASAGWVGEGKPKPLSRQAFDAVTLGHTKLAVITVITEELARFSSPNAEVIIRNDLGKAVVQTMDSDFVDPDNAGTANVKPASITNGVTPIASVGNTEANVRTDLGALFGEWIANNLDVSNGALIMPSSTAMRTGLIVNALGQKAFPNINAKGGELEGLQVITSENAGLTDGSANGKIVILVNASDILLADDGQVSIDISREASVQMDDAPDDPATASTVMVSLWQRNLVGIKAERFINWVKGRATAVSYLSSVNWGEP
jgi:HK97 family phage major capsid protein